MDKLISKLLIPPERVRKDDFVLNLSRGDTNNRLARGRLANQCRTP
jgi:hypothetical protein